MFFCIVTDYYPRGSLDAYLDMMHSGRQTVAPSVSHVHCRQTVITVAMMITVQHTEYAVAFLSVCAFVHHT